MALVELLKKILSPIDEIRKQAENEVNITAKDNFGILILECTKILRDEIIDKSIRQISSILIKNLILNKTDFKGKWFSLDKDLKSSIKQNIFSTLACQDFTIRKASALTIAGINFLSY